MLNHTQETSLEDAGLKFFGEKAKYILNKNNYICRCCSYFLSVLMQYIEKLFHKETEKHFSSQSRQTAPGSCTHKHLF